MKMQPLGEKAYSEKLKQYLKVSYTKFVGHGFYDFVTKASGQNINHQQSVLKQEETSLVYIDTSLGEPFLFWNDDVLDIGGVIDYNPETQMGTFSHITQSGELTIENVHSYHVFGELYPGKLLPFLSLHLPEKAETSNIVVSAIIKNDDQYDLVIYKNTEKIYSYKNVFPEEYIPFTEKSIFKNRIPFVRFAVEKGSIYKNYMYCLRDMKLYRMDDSNSIPSWYIDYGKRTPDWSRFSARVYDGDFFNIFLHLDNSKAAQVISEYIKKADAVEIQDNIFPDDDSINLKVSYKNNPKSVRFLYYCANLHKSFLGFSVMNIPLEDLQKGTKNYEYEHRYIVDSEEIDLGYYKLLNKELYKKEGQKRRINLLPQKVYDNCISHPEMLVYMYQYLRDYYQGKYEAPYIGGRGTFDLGDAFASEKALYDKIFSKIAAREGYKSRWKNELTLYQLIKKEYPDAVYQYHNDWLKRQSLDVYIPSLNLGVEYQGKQHFEAVEFFGGKEGLENTKQRDARKRKLCEENGVRVMEWMYNEPISKPILNKKIKELFS